jgi:hypothetical protein
MMASKGRGSGLPKAIRIRGSFLEGPMTELRITQHTIKNRKIVEIWDGDMEGAPRLIGVIYPMERGVKIVSKYLENRPDVVVIDPEFPRALLVRIWDGQMIDGTAPYEKRGEKP